MKIIAVDDEQLALTYLTNLLAKVVPEAELTGFTSAQKAFDYLAAHGADIMFLDIEMGECSGIMLALKCKELCPAVNLIFVTGYSSYALDAIQMHASGYLMKPVRSEDLLTELENLRNPLPRLPKQRVQVQCFGNFDVFVDAQLLSFPRSKAKELFAYLVHKRGSSCSIKEAAAVLFEDRPYDGLMKNYMQKIVSAMMKTLSEAGAEQVIIRRRNSLAVDIEQVACDVYRLFQMDMQAVNAYTGEYMAQYSWAEFAVGYLDKVMQ